jgi:hypothetical protein
MSTKRQQRYCKTCRRRTQHALDNKGRTCEACGKFASKAEDALSACAHARDTEQRIKHNRS